MCAFNVVLQRPQSNSTVLKHQYEISIIDNIMT